jgi:N-methylhydantoinase A/oxoprolinase/acetone carboxylase beta subunit
VPPFAGVLSALGLAIAPERRESMASVGGSVAALDVGAVSALLDRLRDRAGTVPQGAPRWWMRARYLGQGHELDVSVQQGDSGDAVAARFATLHRERYGFVLDRPAEVVSARCAVSGPPWPVVLARASRAGGEARATGGALVDDGFALDASLHGPASVALPDATLLVREGWNARTLPSGGWLLELTGA